MISHDHRCILVHIERTGGTSVELTLTGVDWWERETQDQKHLTALDSIERYGRETWDRYFTFGFVRNPWDLVVSSYVFFQSRKETGIGFRDFVLSSVTPWRMRRKFRGPWTHARWWREFGKNQLDWLSDADGTPLVDFVGRFERLQGDFDEVCVRIGIPSRPLVHEGRMTRRPYAEYYDGETREAVAQRFRRDIERFGYEF